MKFLSKMLFFLSSFYMLPPKRPHQEKILKEVDGKFNDVDLFLRFSLKQYEAQSFFFLRILWYIFNTFAFFALIPVLILLIVRSLKKTPIATPKSNIVLYPKVPLAIKQKFEPEYIKKPIGYFRSRDLPCIKKIILNAGFRPYFLFRALWKIAVYSEIIDTYQPKNILVTQEMVFESSLLTAYLKDFGIKHINYMHGDNYFSLQVAFCTFSEFYVWHEFYVQLFKSLKTGTTEFHTFQALDRLTSDLPVKNVIKYYNQESRNVTDFNIVLDNLVAFAKEKKCGLVVRLHPLHKKQYEIDLLKTRNIEMESHSINAIDSLCEATYVCSEFSSVLYQATLLGKKLVVDNSFPDRIDIIKDLNIIFMNNMYDELLVSS